MFSARAPKSGHCPTPSTCNLPPIAGLDFDTAAGMVPGDGAQQMVARLERGMIARYYALQFGRVVYDPMNRIR